MYGLNFFPIDECQCTIKLKHISEHLQFTEHRASILRRGEVEYKENAMSYAFTEFGNEMGRTGSVNSRCV